MKTSNMILVLLGVFLLAFIAAMTAIFCVKGAVPDTLIQYTMGAGGVEALLLAGIKVSKIFGAPAGAQRSGSGGERTNSGMTELSPPGGSEGYGACEDDTGDKPRESEDEP